MDIGKYEFTGEKRFHINHFNTADTGGFASKEDVQSHVADNLKSMEEYQDKLYAEGKNGLLIVLQAMDAAGKDGAVKHIFSGLNPQGVDVYNFKQPSAEELSHDYLWRAHKVLPQRGKIAIFNRSYYEEVLVGKVHQLYKSQNLPDRCKRDDIFEREYEQIRNFEEYMWENGITVLKFFLHISKEEQKKRFLERIEDKSKNWKFSKSDLLEREHWEEYQGAYEKAINETATGICPWYVIPSDKKWYGRFLISTIVLKEMKKINPQYPALPEEAENNLQSCKAQLLRD